MADLFHLLSLAEVADTLGIPLSRLYRRIGSLRAVHGFPAPVAGLAHRYDPQAIADWLARQRQAPVPAPAGSAPGTAETAGAETDWAAELDARADRLGRDQHAA